MKMHRPPRLRLNSIKLYLDKSRVAHYLASGVFFTLVGPSVFWLLYPFGPLAAALLTEISCHTIRYLSFKYLIYPAKQGFNVTVLRYIGSVIPVSLLGLVIVSILASRLNRLQLTYALLAISIALSIVINSFVYSSRLGSIIRCRLPLLCDRHARGDLS